MEPERGPVCIWVTCRVLASQHNPTCLRVNMFDQIKIEITGLTVPNSVHSLVPELDETHGNYKVDIGLLTGFK